jgi:hypothetical protein
VSALFAVLVLVAGQVAAFAHAAATRHVTCSEHGEELDTVRLTDQLHDCGDAHFVGVSGDTGQHADCELARALHQSATTSTSFIVIAPASIATLDIEQTSARNAHASAVYRLAPKTSPPRQS